MYFKQIAEIVEGRKTCTQRVVKPGEYEHINEDGEILIVYDAHGRVKWQVGRDYAVSPGRGKPGVWWKDCGEHPAPGFNRYALSINMPWLPKRYNWREIVGRRGLVPLRIRILQIERVELHSMDERVAVAEGVDCRAAYVDLWNAINGAKAWDKNPDCWRLWFEVVKPEIPHVRKVEEMT